MLVLVLTGCPPSVPLGFQKIWLSLLPNLISERSLLMAFKCKKGYLSQHLRFRASISDDAYLRETGPSESTRLRVHKLFEKAKESQKLHPSHFKGSRHPCLPTIKKLSH